MFRNDVQKCDAIRVLLGPALARTFWNSKGPTEVACNLVERRGIPLSHRERILLFVAFDLWNGDGHADLGQIVNVLDSEDLRRIGTLLVAIASQHGDRAIDTWIKEWGRSKKQR